jgi:3-deoxy-D-manno-octulosonate 8-phosphate phosphatase (KDO 8-P phosphatase)
VTAPDELKQIKLLLLDVDGVLTDGGIVYDSQGSETKAFDVRDGLGIKLLVQSGIAVGIVTGRRSAALSHRCRDLGIDMVFDAVADKASVLQEALERTGVRVHEVAFVGDDLPDLPLMRRVGVAIAVADAHEMVRAVALLITRAPGGRGAVREVCEQILKSQGLWDHVTGRFDK